MGSITAATDRLTFPTQAPAPGAATCLKVEGVSLRYPTPDGGEFYALENVSLEVKEQQFAVLVGPSGCGKSSLLYLTAGLAEASSGQILVNGRPVDGPGPDRGMVFQAYTLFPWLTVRQNIEFGLKRRKVGAAERKEMVEHYLNEVGLTRFADNYSKQLSGGMKQRVAIARALANDPQILLMDEPFGALDSQTRLQMQQLLLKVWEHSKKTVLFVTHDIDEAILLGDQIFAMGARPGRIKQVLNVPIERPRHLDMVMDPSFIAMKKSIFHLLHDGNAH
ncbi:ABC transporter ATP-binding protein [Pseudomonas sp. DC3200b2]|uniref:ABC transporter ATP-binding protein n=1 Tax=Pseudomonas sp. DC3200b2 TaxID=2804669 RepID=UPI003CE7D4D3